MKNIFYDELNCKFDKRKKKKERKKSNFKFRKCS